MHNIIKAMNLDAYIEHHLIHSVGHYYEGENELWSSMDNKFVELKLEGMA